MSFPRKRESKTPAYAGVAPRSMKIINITKNIILAENAAVANTLISRIIGLLGRRELKKGEALILLPCYQIHTFFMRFPIDILFVNKKDKVIAAICNLKPWRITPLYFTASFAAELPAGTIKTTSIQIGDILSLNK